MSVYNGERYLKSAIDSILNQTLKDFEFIIIDDGSTDKSREIINSYKDVRIKLIIQDNKGLAYALNKGIKYARGKYIARMDADDISFLNRLKKQYHFLEENLNCLAVGSNALIIDEDDNYIYSSKLETDWCKIKENLPNIPFFHSSVLFKKNAFHNVGGYPELMLRAQDAVLFNKIAKFGEICNLGDVLIKYRLVHNSLSIDKSKKMSKFLTALIIKSINDEDLTSEDISNFKRLVSSKSISYNKSIYYLHIAKKYLWNNFQPKLARNNLKKSLKISPLNLKAWLLFFLSLFPHNIIIIIYNKIKK